MKLIGAESYPKESVLLKRVLSCDEAIAFSHGARTFEKAKYAGCLAFLSWCTCICKGKLCLLLDVHLHVAF